MSHLSAIGQNAWLYLQLVECVLPAKVPKQAMKVIWFWCFICFPLSPRFSHSIISLKWWICAACGCGTLIITPASDDAECVGNFVWKLLENYSSRLCRKLKCWYNEIQHTNIVIGMHYYWCHCFSCEARPNPSLIGWFCGLFWKSSMLGLSFLPVNTPTSSASCLGLSWSSVSRWGIADRPDVWKVGCRCADLQLWQSERSVCLPGKLRFMIRCISSWLFL